jgi:hypothetical protein
MFPAMCSSEPCMNIDVRTVSGVATGPVAAHSPLSSHGRAP